MKVYAVFVHVSFERQTWLADGSTTILLMVLIKNIIQNVFLLRSIMSWHCRTLFMKDSANAVYNWLSNSLPWQRYRCWHDTTYLPNVAESSGWMFLLVPAHPGFPGQIPQSRKTVVVVVVVVLLRLIYSLVPVLWCAACVQYGTYAVISDTSLFCYLFSNMW